jgi:3,4-dihydroxy 2-butanone 4-phosphate synthase/GTP cyclohydrolase II
MDEILAEGLAALRAGNMVVVVDDDDRENEGDLVIAASAMTPAIMAFYLRYGSGIVCAPMPDGVADGLELPLMVSRNEDRHRTAFTISVDECNVGTGISAADRAATVRALAEPGSTPRMFHRPGHVFPLRARPGGVLKRAGHTEASVDLLMMAGVESPVAVITELVGDDGVPLHGSAVVDFAEEHGLRILRIEDLLRARRRNEQLVLRSGTAMLPLDEGAFAVHCFTSVLDGVEHLALTLGDVAAPDRAGRGVLVRVHSECLTGDVFGSNRCDCGDQLGQALRLIAAEGVGVVVYLRGHEGRGIGLSHKIQAYALQEQGTDTVDANLALGLPVDSREYGIGAAILADLGVQRLRLITNSPQKYSGIAGYDLELVGRVRTHSRVTQDNLAYLRTKRDRLGHELELPDAAEVDTCVSN